MLGDYSHGSGHGQGHDSGHGVGHDSGHGGGHDGGHGSGHGHDAVVHMEHAPVNDSHHSHDSHDVNEVSNFSTRAMCGIVEARVDRPGGELKFEHFTECIVVH